MKRTRLLSFPALLLGAGLFVGLGQSQAQPTARCELDVYVGGVLTRIEKPAEFCASLATATPTPTQTPTATPTRTATPTATATPESTNCLGAPAYPEIRDSNATQNQTPGQPVPAGQYQEWNPGFGPYKDLVNGQGCTGTTEQILEWAAKKWGFADTPGPFGQDPINHPDLAKAMAVTESDWRQWVEGDNHGGECHWVGGPDCPYPYGNQSFGIISVKRTSWPGSYPLSTQSTAFTADYAMAAVRHHYDGKSWLGTAVQWNLWESVEAWYSGKADSSGDWYQADVRKHYAERTWTKPEFAALHP